jgi:hypothetical protein
LRVLVHVITLSRHLSIVLLRLYIPATDLNGVEFIGPYAAIQQLLPPGFAVEVPFVTNLDKRHREGPVLVAYEQKGASPSCRLYRNALLFTSLSGKSTGALPILRHLSSEYNVLPVGSKYLGQLGGVELLCRIHQSFDSLLRRFKGFGRRALGSSGSWFLSSRLLRCEKLR